MGDYFLLNLRQMAHCIEHILRENAAKDIVLHMAIRVLQQGISIYFPLLSVRRNIVGDHLDAQCIHGFL